MGLKSKLNKMKSFLFDEEDEEKEIEKPLKKSLTQKVVKKTEEKKERDFSKTKEALDLDFEDISDSRVPNEIKSRTVKKENEFNFPEFDDDDFMVTKTKPEPIIPAKKEEVKPVLYQGSKRKEESKKFKPSPIISPIYGLLDEEGNKVSKEEEKTLLTSKNKEDVTFDAVRKKAYGKIDEEIENTMKRLNKKTIEEAEKDALKEENLSRTNKKIKEAKVIDKEPIFTSLEDDDDDDMILPNINFKEIDVDKETSHKKEIIDNKKDDDDEDTKEQDLFNLIDTMYAKEEGEE